MKRFSAHFIYTNTGFPLKRAVVTADDDGKIISIHDTGGTLQESRSVEFFNGIIIPGFINCHCHLELSHMKGVITGGKGLDDFIKNIRSSRDDDPQKIVASARASDGDMYGEGISVCADICNTSLTFGIKKESRIRYLNMIEVFGIDPEKAGRRMNEFLGIAGEAVLSGLTYSIVPHSVYSVSRPLFRLLRNNSNNNKVTSIHFMETEGEKAFLSDHSGPLAEAYRHSGLMPPKPETIKSHSDAIMNEMTQSGNLIVVHNTFADTATVRDILKRGNTYWCLCPRSNIYIEGRLAPVEMLVSEGCEIVIGTDSLASNNTLSILSELKTLQECFPQLSMEQMIRWATFNGARALGEERDFGTIEPGKKPGLLLLENLDIASQKLLPDTTVTRLI
ncbi:MAG: amidohydrolase family protein [Bacteroidales bacterium]|nr:amidohydrolase family protein [Bacteroidales bacterium]